MASISLKGMDKLNKGLTDRMKLEAAMLIVKQNGAELQQKAMRNAPVRTGNLKRSIKLAIEDGGLTARCEATAEYAPYVEWGTRFMEARPFMEPAYEQQLRIFKADMEKLAK